MPTFRDDLHLGHKVPTVEGDDIVNHAITEQKTADDSVSTRVIQYRAVTEPKLADDAVSTRTIQDGAVTEPKLADDSVSARTIQPESIDGANIKPGSIEDKHLAPDAVTTSKIKDKAVTPAKRSEEFDAEVVLPYVNSVDGKYQNITDELYSLIESLQVSGIALSQQFGNRTDIGISQKTLTKAFGKFWDEMANITGKTYMDFKLTVVPAITYSEASQVITITADCSDAISDFDSIKIYIDNVLIAESSDQEVFTTSASLSKTAVVKAVGTILGKQVTKTVTAIKEIPFFMGSGHDYHDVINEDCRKTIVGTIEGDYDVTVRNADEYIFVIIPISRKEEFRRCKMDMNGLEIPITEEEHSRYIVCKTINTYKKGTYNIDIDINS